MSVTTKEGGTAPRTADAPAERPADKLRAGLLALAGRLWPGASAIEDLRRLSAGATLETWSFDVVTPVARRELILRRAPGGLRARETLSLTDEAALVASLAGTGVPVAEVVHALVPEDGIGDGFIMVRIHGETIPRKLLRDAEFAVARERFVGQCGRILAALHATPVNKGPALATRGVEQMLASMERRHLAMMDQRRGSPVFAMALRWLRDHMPAQRTTRLVHGDFRIGNLMVDGDGISAVLDWEIAHLGDPVEDLAWICLPPWRFGNIDRPVGGVGSREELWRAYEAAGGEPVDPARVHFWDVMGALRWGLGTAGMAEWFRSGGDTSPERAMIARRVSENELDLMRQLAGGDHAR